MVSQADLRYQLSKKYSVSANASYQTLKRTNKNDGLEDGFNTPEWMANMSFNGTNIYRSLGFTVSAKYQSSYYWQSFLVNGKVPPVFNMSTALYYSFEKPSIGLKIGATNMFNRYYYSILGSPQIGGLYYTTVTYAFR